MQKEEEQMRMKKQKKDKNKKINNNNEKKKSREHEQKKKKQTKKHPRTMKKTVVYTSGLLSVITTTIAQMQQHSPPNSFVKCNPSDDSCRVSPQQWWLSRSQSVILPSSLHSADTFRAIICGSPGCICHSQENDLSLTCTVTCYRGHRAVCVNETSAT